MPDVTKFSVRAYQVRRGLTTWVTSVCPQVSGTSDYLRNDLKSSMALVGTSPTQHLAFRLLPSCFSLVLLCCSYPTLLPQVGRIPPKVCWDYIDKISQNPQKEILVLRFGPQNNDEVAAYDSFFQYLSSRDRSVLLLLPLLFLAFLLSLLPLLLLPSILLLPLPQVRSSR